MTEIRSTPPVSQRPGDVGVHSLDGFHLIVPNLKQAAAFYGAFGLQVDTHGNGLSLSTYENGRRWGTLSEGKSKKLSHISYGIFENDVRAFEQRLKSEAVRRIDGPDELDDGGLWFRNPDGLLIELRVAGKTSPDQKSPFSMTSAAAGKRGSPLNASAPSVRPERLAHMLVFTTDISRAIGFNSRVLGLRLSDRVGDGAAFMHGIHGSDHHLIALGKADRPGLHHLSWDVPSINDIGYGAMQMARHGYNEGWGLGRHALGSNYFHYVRDPWGSYSEYSSDIDFIPAGCNWDASDHPPEDTFYIWGPQPPADFIHNYEN